MRAPVLSLSFAVVLASCVPALAQGRWSWPEKSENLQVLPQDLSAERLREVMGGFSQALGVRCSYCHVGEEGQPLSEYDFASDENPMKDRARLMLNMVEGIEKSLEHLEPSGDERVEVSCHTCHRGVTKPRTLVAILADAHESGGTAAVADRYRELHDEYHGRGAYDFGERSLVQLAWGRLRAERPDEAIEILELNLEQFPRSSMTQASLAEAHAQAGRMEEAIIHLGAALAADPDDRRARARLRELLAAGSAEGEAEDDAPRRRRGRR